MVATKNSFTPISSPNARLLVLGSLPGERSLSAQEYYAHPRNAFWWIIESIINIPENSCYTDKINALKKHGIALWDVVASCQRQGSLDSSIDHNTVKPNDIYTFVKQHTLLQAIVLNGQSATQLFRRHVVRSKQLVQHDISHLSIITMPSTSPANARYSREEKLALWKAITRYLIH